MAFSGLVPDYLGSGLLASRPAAPTLAPGTVGLYYCTDVGSEKLTAWDGAVWADIAGGGGGMTNPMTTAEDIIVGGVAGAPARLGKGADGSFLGVVAGALAYATPGGSGTVTSVGSGTGLTGGPITTSGSLALSSGSIASLALADSAVQPAALAAVSPIGLHSVPIMAGAIQPSVAGGCSAVTSIASAANQPDLVTIDFDPTTQEYAQFAIPMPKSWNEGTLTAEFRWSHAATTTNFGVVFNIQAVAVSNDDTIAVNFGTAQQVADTGGTTNDLYISAQTPAFTVGGSPAAGDTVFFRVSRVTGDGSDTMAIDARLHSVVLYMTTDASTDA